jgi:hypothetical protein
MSRGWSFASGDWNINCDVCSIKIKASESKERWDGFIVCPNCWEPRQSLDFVRARQDKISVPFARPIPPEVFTNVPYIPTGNSCTPQGASAIPNWAIPGCMIPNNDGV